MSIQVTVIRGGWSREKAQKPGGGWDKWWNEESKDGNGGGGLQDL